MLHSRKGSGTTAELCCPLPKRRRNGLVPPGDRNECVSSAHDSRGERRNPCLMNTVAMLEELGRTVFKACSGKEALEILRREDSVDLGVTDQAMPKMTGRTLPRLSLDASDHLPVVAADRKCLARLHKRRLASRAIDGWRRRRTGIFKIVRTRFGTPP